MITTHRTIVAAGAAGVCASALLWQWRRRPKAPLVLTYLAAKGTGEMIRLALHIGRVPFVDRRVSYEEVAALRRAGALPCGQVPVLEVDGETYCQSASILRYVGKAAGLYPADPATALRCDMVCDALDELRRDLNPLWCRNSASTRRPPSDPRGFRYGAALRRDPTTAAPGVPLSAEQRAAAAAAVRGSYLPTGFQRLEAVLGDRPYFCGGKLTIADVALFVDASQILDGEFDEALGVGAAVLADCPGLRRLCLRVRRHPRVRDWARPKFDAKLR